MSRLNNNPDLENVKEPIIKEIMSFHRMTEEEAEDFLRKIRSWCASNVTNSKWNNVDPRAKSKTTYGLKHECERDLDRYVSNNWMKAALYLEGFPLKKDRDRTKITVKDMFDNVVNLNFKDYGV